MQRSSLRFQNGSAGVEGSGLKQRLELRQRMPGFEHFDQVIKPAGFDQVGVGAQFAGALHIGGAGGGRENVHGQAFEGRLPAEPFQGFESALLGHFQIEQ